MDDDDIYIPPRPKERSSFMWLGIITLAIVLGTLIADGIRLLAANAWMNYQLEQLAKEFHSEKAETRQRAEGRRETLQTQEAEKKMQLYECLFWQDQYRSNPSAKNEAKKMQSCRQAK
ncbi:MULTISPECIES: hypothetical protein [unclassified Pseudomonas]|uniref:hypothetical protein n=1 Tax=unclassified Pseudomonas TaxID=196821 RepID=UPI00244D0514|nr:MULTISPECIES: hypothetical protein [unclassified Pseudomonas]MDH0894717.1 hypothetical protein [Pseudomonas sp. GD03875]MDH1065214.1 hypothetical protein [Pseudomonas sp. GD03985]